MSESIINRFPIRFQTKRINTQWCLFVLPAHGLELAWPWRSNECWFPEYCRLSYGQKKKEEIMKKGVRPLSVRHASEILIKQIKEANMWRSVWNLIFNCHSKCVLVFWVCKQVYFFCLSTCCQITPFIFLLKPVTYRSNQNWIVLMLFFLSSFGLYHFPFFSSLFFLIIILVLCFITYCILTLT